jgi:hypothetical protein
VLLGNGDGTFKSPVFYQKQGSNSGVLAVAALQPALGLGVEAPTLSASDPAAIVTQRQGIESQLASLSNTVDQGHCVFARTATNTAPFVAGASPSGSAATSKFSQNNLSVHLQWKSKVLLRERLAFQPPNQEENDREHDTYQDGTRERKIESSVLAAI